MWGLLFFFMVMNLTFWWISRSSSVSLLMVLAFSFLSTASCSLIVDMGVPLFMVVLALSGGLFVLVSFVIMFFPSDFKGKIFSGMNYFWIFNMFFFFVFFFISSGNFFFWNKGVNLSVKVWGNFFFIYMFLIILLFMFLFLVNSVLNPSTGGMFSGKKIKGKMMG